VAALTIAYVRKIPAFSLDCNVVKVVQPVLLNKDLCIKNAVISRK